MYVCIQFKSQQMLAYYVGLNLPSLQVQSGSPSSSPLVLPSPSESASHRSFVHDYNKVTILLVYKIIDIKQLYRCL